MARPITIVLVLLLAALLAAPMGLLYFLAFTPQGISFITSRLPGKLGPVELELGEVSGTLAHGFHLRRFELRHDRVHVVASNVSARVSIAPLLWQTITLPHLEAERLLVRIRPKDEPPSKGEPRFLPAFLRISTEDVRIGEGSLVLIGGQRYDVSGVQASGIIAHRVIRLFSANLRFEPIQIAGNVTLRAATPMRIEGDARLLWNAPEKTGWIVNLTGDGDLDRLGLEATISAPFRADFKGAALDLTRAWNWRGDAVIHDFDLRAFGGGSALGFVTGTLALNGDGDGIRANGIITPAGLGMGEFDTDFDGSYGQRTLRVRALEFKHRTTGAAATAGGRIYIEAEGPRLDLEGGWSHFRWPLSNEAPVFTSVGGDFTLRGRLPFAVSARGELSVTGLPTLPLTFAGSLASDHLAADRLTVNAYGGRAELNGNVRWSPQDTWTVAGRITNLDTGKVRENLPGNVNFNVSASGRGFGGGDIDVRVANLSGRVRGGAAAGKGHLLITPSAYVFDDVNIALGSARFHADGRLADGARDIRFDFATDDLALIDPTARGTVEAKGTIAGTAAAPLIDVTAKARAFDYAGITLEALDGKLSIDAREGRPAVGDLKARGFQMGDRRIETIVATLEGTTSNHRIKLDAVAEPLRVRIAADGAFASPAWTLRFAGIDIEDGGAVDLSLGDPSTLTLQPESIDLARTCLRGNSARLCVEGLTNAQRWSAKASATNLPVATLTAGQIRDVAFDGTIDAEASAGAEAGAPWTGSLRAELKGANARRTMPSGREEITVLGAGLIDANATAETLALRVTLDAERRDTKENEKGSIFVSANATRDDPDWRLWPLTGVAQVRTSTLGFIALLVDPIDRAEGKLDAELVLGGALGAPEFTGRLDLTEGQFDLYQINMRLRDVALKAKLAANRLNLEGAARAGDGSAKVTGDIEWREGLPYGKLTLDGEDFRVANVPEASVLASPDLDFAIDGRHIHVTGEVKLPYARLDPADVTNAVFPSADEKIIGEGEADPSKQFSVSTEVRVTLGDRVTIDTLGLSGRLSGSVLARTNEQDIARGTGELNVEEGKYVAFGRKLDVERGRLIFSNGPLADPGIDIRASKEFPDVTAGANVRGTLRAPRLTLFSDPQISQSQILSLLLAGGSLESVQSQDGSSSGRGGNALAVQGGAILAQQLGSYVGLEDVSLESTLDNDTSLVLGKYLTPRLYVSYGISLTEAINTVKMRYTLGDRWTVKFESGQQQSADLEYTIEK